MLEAAVSSAAAPLRRFSRAPSHSASPSLYGPVARDAAAFEVKFLLDEATAVAVETAARAAMRPDPYAEADGAYRTTTLYLDTPEFAILRGGAGFQTSKFRVRRYGEAATLFVEEKRRTGDRVVKLRAAIAAADLPRAFEAHGDAGWEGEWFRRKVAMLRLRPACRMSYRRTAFSGEGAEGPIRLTLDRRVRGAPAEAGGPTGVDDGADLLDGRVICEFKFTEVLPWTFKRILLDVRMAPARISKYRRFMETSGLLRRLFSTHA